MKKQILALLALTSLAASAYNSNNSYNDPNLRAIEIGKYALGATDGSIIFADNGAVAQSNLKLFWDQANSRLGLTDTSPDATLDVNGTLLISGAVTAQSTVATGALTVTGAASTTTTLAAGTTLSSGGIATLNGLTLTGSVIKPIRTVTTTDTASCANDWHMNMNGSTGFTQTLPTAASCSGVTFVYNLINNGSAQTVTIDAAGSELIDSATTSTLTLTNQTLGIQSDGVKWFSFSH